MIVNDIMKLPPWARGPYEIIRHSDGHLKLSGDTDRRIALIGFDNAIEICIDTFISLHPKLRHNVEISKDDLEKIKRNYHTKIEYFYDYAEKENIDLNISIEDVIFYHDLRNKLYHSGNGLTPEKYLVEGARSAAYLVFRILFREEMYPTYENPVDEDIHKSEELSGKRQTDTATLGEKKNKYLSKDEADEWLDIFRQQDKPEEIRRNYEKDVSLVAKNIWNGKILLTWKAEELPNRYSIVSLLPDERYGIQILEWDNAQSKWIIIETIIKKNLNEVKKYMNEIRFIRSELPSDMLNISAVMGRSSDLPGR